MIIVDIYNLQRQSRFSQEALSVCYLIVHFDGYCRTSPFAVILLVIACITSNIYTSIDVP